MFNEVFKRGCLPTECVVICCFSPVHGRVEGVRVRFYS